MLFCYSCSIATEICFFFGSEQKQGCTLRFVVGCLFQKSTLRFVVLILTGPVEVLSLIPTILSFSS